MAEAPATEEQAETQDDQQDAGVAVQEAQLPEASDSGGAAGIGPVDLLLDATVAVTACLGDTEIEVRELLQLGKGSVVKLDRAVGEPVDLFLRGHMFARGRLVVVGEQLGVRVEEIVPAKPGQPDA